MIKSKKILGRIVLDFLIAVSILNGWWFVALPLGIVGVWIYKNYFEFIIAGVAYDALFGMVKGTGWIGYIGTIISVIMYTVITRLHHVIFIS